STKAERFPYRSENPAEMFPRRERGQGAGARERERKTPRPRREERSERPGRLRAAAAKQEADAGNAADQRRDERAGGRNVRHRHLLAIVRAGRGSDGGRRGRKAPGHYGG